MKVIAEKAVNAAFESLGAVAVYEPKNRISEEILVIHNKRTPEADHFSVKTISDSYMFDIRAVDVEEPEKGDRIHFQDKIYQVTGVPRLKSQDLIWEVEAPPDA